MELLKAVEIEPGKWIFARVCGEHVEPIGYCAPYVEYWENPNLAHLVTPEEVQACKKDCLKHHVEGHASAQEAAACYQSYIIDHSLKLMQCVNRHYKCEICGEWTTYYAEIADVRRLYLCPNHNTKDKVRALFVIRPDQEIVTEE